MPSDKRVLTIIGRRWGFRRPPQTFNAKIPLIILRLGGVMAKSIQISLLEKVPVLILLGILAGAVGGLGIGLVMAKASSSTSAGR